MDHRRDVEAAFRSSPDGWALIGPDGVVVAVNDAWTTFAAGAGPARTGVGADYLGVCRRAARLGAPRAREAYGALTDVLHGRRRAASVAYPCSTPSGVRWFRGDVHPVGRSGVVGVRHVDVTESLTAGPGAVTADLVRAAPRVLTETALRLALADLLDGPPELATLVLTTATATPPGVVPGGVDADLVARLDPDVLAVLVTAPDLPAAMDRARAVVDTASTRTEWGIAVRTPRDTAASLVARARRTLTPAGGDGESFDDRADRARRLHRAADVLATAVGEFDDALDAGAPMARLVELDRTVLQAERALVLTALDYRGI